MSVVAHPPGYLLEVPSPGEDLDHAAGEILDQRLRIRKPGPPGRLGAEELVWNERRVNRLRRQHLSGIAPVWGSECAWIGRFVWIGDLTRIRPMLRICGSSWSCGLPGTIRKPGVSG